jgi:hypothetical protein
MKWLVRNAESAFTFMFTFALGRFGYVLDG